MPLDSMTEVSEALEAAGTGLEKLVAAVQQLVASGVRGFDIVVARRAASRLRNISALGTRLGITQRAVLDEIEGYLQHPDPAKWLKVTEELQEILVAVTEVFSMVQRERSEFVAEPAYELLMSTLYSRSLVVSGLIDLPAPKSAHELEELAVVHDKYRNLLDQLRIARNELNEYLKQQSN